MQNLSSINIAVCFACGLWEWGVGGATGKRGWCSVTSLKIMSKVHAQCLRLCLSLRSTSHKR